jgi:hypothetical protein
MLWIYLTVVFVGWLILRDNAERDQARQEADHFARIDNPTYVGDGWDGWGED